MRPDSLSLFLRVLFLFPPLLHRAILVLYIHEVDKVADERLLRGRKASHVIVPKSRFLA